MIIDFHGHLFPSWKGIAGMPAGEMIREMDRNGVDKTVVFTLNGFWGDFSAWNDRLYQATQEQPDRLIPFGTVHPYALDASLREIKRCRDELGMKGIKFHPWLQGFSVISDEMIRVAAEMCKLGMILVMHDGTPPYTEPLQIAHLAARFPELRVILGHGGLKDFHQEAGIALRKHKNLYITTTAPASPLKRLCLETQGERIVFGSDIGFGGVSQRYYLHIFRSLSLPEDIEKRVLYRNASALLGL